MMGVGAVKNDVAAMILTGFAGVVAGACSIAIGVFVSVYSQLAIGVFVSVYSQLDVEVAQMKRDKRMTSDEENKEECEKEQLPNPMQASFSIGLCIFNRGIGAFASCCIYRRLDYKVRLAVVIAAATLALATFGGVGALLGRTPVVMSCARVLIGGWIAMAITFGLIKLIGSSGL